MRKYLGPILAALLAACAATPEVGWQARHAANELAREAVRFAQEPLPHAWTPVETTTAPVALNAPIHEDGRSALTYAGGIEIRSGFNRFHGLSDLDFAADGRTFWSIVDEGLLVRGRIVLDAAGRLTGVEGVEARPLTDPDGQSLIPKYLADAEGMALMPGGDLLVSFEREHRVWRYDPDDGRWLGERAIPDFAFPENDGMEGIAAARLQGAFWATGENGGWWLCRIELCQVWREPPTERPSEDDLRITSLAAHPNEDAVFVLERAYHADRNTNTIRISLMTQPGVHMRFDQLRPLAEFTAPATVDNFEGIAAVRRPDGGVRLYILSDDNFNPGQRTLLMAFDVR